MNHGSQKPRFLAGPDDGKLDYYEEAGHRSGRDIIVLEEDFVFLDSLGRVRIAPKGLRYDGASIPKIFHSIVGHPFESRHILAGAIHDQEYQTGFRLTVDPEVLALELARRALGSIGELAAAEVGDLPRVEVVTDRYETDYFAFYEPLLATPGNTLVHARVIYRAVRLGGWAAWNGHVRRRAVERRPFSRLTA